MSFSEADLEIFKKDIATKRVPGFVWLSGLVSRLEAAERVIERGDACEDFDCPHSESPCKCGEIQIKLIDQYHEARDTWRKSKEEA